MCSGWRSIAAAWNRQGKITFCVSGCSPMSSVPWVFPLVLPLCCRAAHRPGKSLPKYLQNGNCDYSWKPELVTGASSSLLHLLNPRKLIIKITHRLDFLGALLSVLMIVLDFRLKVDFFFKWIWLERKIKGWRGRKALRCHPKRLMGVHLCSLCLKSPARSCSLYHFNRQRSCT